MTPFGFLESPSHDCTRFMRLIEEQWPEPDQPPADQTMALIERAVDKCPHLPELWIMRAELVTLCLERSNGEATPYTLDDVLLSLHAAAKIRPNYIEAHEAIAEFCEKELEDFAAAEAAYARAIELGGGPWVYTGLARVLARQGAVDEALAALDPEFCPYHDEEEVQALRRKLR